MACSIPMLGLLVLLAVPAFQAGATNSSSVFRTVVLADDGDDALEQLAVWRPILQDRLTAEAKLLNLNVTFTVEVVSDREEMSRMLDDEDPTNWPHFTLLSEKPQTCFSTDYWLHPINSVAFHLPQGEVFEYEGALMFTRASGGSNVKSWHDLNNEIIALGRPDDSASMMAWYEMAEHNISLLNDPRQTLFFDSEMDVIDAVLFSRIATVGVLHTGTMEELIRADTLRWSDVNVVLELMDTRTANNFPFRTSTHVTPSLTLSSLSTVPEEVQGFVLETLIDIGEVATPHTAEFSSVSFHHAKSAMFYRNVLEKLDVLQPLEHECRLAWQPFDILRCPEGHMLKTEDELETVCPDASGVACPDHAAHCICKPCVDRLPQEVWYNDEIRCERAEVCSSVKQLDYKPFHVMDWEWSQRTDTPVVTYLFHTDGKDDYDSADNHTRVAEYIGHGIHEFYINSPKLGTHTITVKINGEHVDASPYIVRIVQRDCPSHMHANPSAECVCDGDSLPFGSRCVLKSKMVPIIVVPLCVLLVGLYFAYSAYRQYKEDLLWRIKSDMLEFDKPPVILGNGAFGVVLQGTYRGTQVAVKQAIPPELLRKMKGGRGGSKSKSVNAKTLSQGYMQSLNKSFRGAQKTMFRTARSTIGTAIWKRTTMAQMRKDFKSEIRTLMKLRHPCICTLMGAVVERGQAPVIVMELLEKGSLYEMIHNETAGDQIDVMLAVLKDVISGMVFLHQGDPPIVHGDLKSQNVLIDSNLRGKICDFGLSAKNKAGIGTPIMMAPELLRKGKPTLATDVYAFGVMLNQVFTRKDPYEDEDDLNVVLEKVADMYLYPPHRPPMCPQAPPVITALIEESWHPDPEARPDFTDIDRRFRTLNIDSVSQSLLKAGAETQKNSRVLHDVFPKHIAEALKEGRQVPAEHKESVTIFFSDIVGFTNISAKLKPEQVSNMLDRLYSRFDELSLKHQVFKVETIGDAYMAATNLVEDQADHALRIATFALDAIKAASETPVIEGQEHEHGYVNIRVGFHTGPVVAGVVGSRNPRYCLFGDTVNTASRMESNSIANHVHCSASAASALKQQLTQDADIEIESRGVVNIKGKGEMHTYFVWRKDEPRPNRDDSSSRPRPPLAKKRSTHIFIPSEPTARSRKVSNTSQAFQDAYAAATAALHDVGESDGPTICDMSSALGRSSAAASRRISASSYVSVPDSLIGSKARQPSMQAAIRHSLLTMESTVPSGNSCHRGHGSRVAIYNPIAEDDETASSVCSDEHASPTKKNTSMV